MNRLLKYNGLSAGILAIVLLLLGSTNGFSQPENPQYSLSSGVLFEVDMQPLALIDLENAGGSLNFDFNVPLPVEAGLGFGENPILTNNSYWLNYSCALRTALSRHISVNLDGSSGVPAGFEIRLDISESLGSGGGTLGSSTAGTITLTQTPQEIISGVKGSFTGSGAGNGHQLSYSLHYVGPDFSLVESQSATIHIIYTIIDN